MVATNIPGPRGLPGVGILPSLSSGPLEFFALMRRSYGDVVRLPIAHTSLTMMCDPEGIEEILLTSARAFHKDKVTQYLGVTLGEGLLVSEGEAWKRSRRMVAPALRKRHVASYARTMVDVATRHAARLADGQILDILNFTMGLSLEIVARTLFGADVHDDAKQIGETIERMMTEFVRYVRTWRRLLPGWVPTPSRLSIQRDFKTIDDVIYRIIEERRRSGADGDDLLSLMLAARDEDGSTLSDKQLRDEAVTIFVAGHETTSLTLSFTLHQLSEHPEVREAVEAEVDAIVGQRPVTMQDMERLPVTMSVLKESLRLYPPAWAIGRQPLEDMEIAGYMFSAGDQIIIPQWLVHRDTRYYKAPAEFRPERWRNGETDDLPRFAYFPFGGGPRTCPGNHYAMMEALLALVTLMQHARFEALSGKTPALVPSITLRPRDGLRMRIRVKQRPQRSA